jgi:flagellar basal-body rod modification protein FlgD
MAQINTVDGISRLNDSVKSLGTYFVQMQALQGASLVGHEVSVEGDRMLVAAGKGQGGFELAGTADHVRLEVLSAAGRVIGTQDLGALSEGRHSFEWTAGAHTDGEGLRFRIVATQGAAAVTAKTLMRDRVEAVSADGSGLALDLERSGIVAYDRIAAVH